MNTTRQSRAWARWLTACWFWTLAVALPIGGGILADEIGQAVPRQAVRPVTDGLALSSEIPSSIDPRDVRLQRIAGPRSEERQRFLPRVNGRLQSLQGMTRSDGPNHLLDEDAFHDQMTEAVRHGVTRASRKAAKDFLLETTRLEDKIDAMRDRRRDRRQADAVGAPGASEDDPSRFDFDVRFHSAMPQVVMRYDMSRGDMKFVVDPQGSVKVRYRSETLGRAEIQADFDGDDSYRLVCRFGF